MMIAIYESRWYYHMQLRMHPVICIMHRVMVDAIVNVGR
jgi:hypothetical protein